MLPRLLFLVLFFRSASGYSTGAPVSQCGDMQPNTWIHWEYETTKASEHYNISVSSSTYSDEPLSVTILTTKDDYKFKGFLLQARYQDAPDMGAIGRFDKPLLPPATQILNCGNGDGVTHSPKGLHKSLTFTWTPPEGAKSRKIVFYATIVKSRNYYWVQHKSVPITYKEKEIVEEETEEAKTTPTKPVELISTPAPTEDKPIDETKEEKIVIPEKEGKPQGKKGKKEGKKGGKRRGGRKQKERGQKKEGKGTRKDRRKNKENKDGKKPLSG